MVLKYKVTYIADGSVKVFTCDKLKISSGVYMFIDKSEDHNTVVAAVNTDLVKHVEIVD